MLKCYLSEVLALCLLVRYISYGKYLKSIRFIDGGLVSQS